MKYGYARVLTDGQSVDAQVRQLTKAGCKKVFREVASGAKTDRAQLRRFRGQFLCDLVVVKTKVLGAIAVLALLAGVAQAADGSPPCETVRPMTWSKPAISPVKDLTSMIREGLDHTSRHCRQGPPSVPLCR